MIQRPPGVGAFQFVILAKLRAAQLMRGCLPRVEGPFKATTLAQIEVAQGKVTQLVDPPPEGAAPVPEQVADVPVLVGHGEA